jgi:hypothetical protein
MCTRRRRVREMGRRRRSPEDRWCLYTHKVSSGVLLLSGSASAEGHVQVLPWFQNVSTSPPGAGAGKCDELASSKAKPTAPRCPADATIDRLATNRTSGSTAWSAPCGRCRTNRETWRSRSTLFLQQAGTRWIGSAALPLRPWRLRATPRPVSWRTSMSEAVSLSRRHWGTQGQTPLPCTALAATPPCGTPGAAR